MDLAAAQPPATRLGAAQQAFRQTPNQQTALAYMDAAIAEWDNSAHDNRLSNIAFAERMRDIREWLAIPVANDLVRMIACKGV